MIKQLTHGLRVATALLTGLIFFTAYTPPTIGALVTYEGFDYPAGSDLTDANGGTGWSTPWVHTDNAAAAVPAGVQTALADSLAYTDTTGKKLRTSGGKALFSGTNGTTSMIGRNMDTRRGTDGTTTWVSFIGQRRGDKSGTAGPDGAPTYERGVNLTLWDTTLTTAATAQRLGLGENSGVLAGQPNDTWGISAQGAGSQRRQTTNDFDKVTFVVVRIDHKGDETVPDDIYFWVNPLLGPAPDIANASTNILSSETPPAGYTYDYTFDRIRQFAGNASGAQAFGEWFFDEFRVGDSYTDVAPIDSPLLAYEGFDYADGDDLTGKDGGIGWTTAWGANAGGMTNPQGNVAGDRAVASSFNYTDSKGNKLVTTGGHALYGDVAGTQPFRNFPGRGDTGTTTWISFLGQRSGTTVEGSNPYPRGANMALFLDNSERVGFGNASGATLNGWGIVGGAGNLANLKSSTVPFQNLTFIVVRIDHQEGNDDVYLFLNPTDLATEPNINSATTNTLGEFEYAFNRVRPFTGNDQTATGRPQAEISLDEIRIGTTYAAVTPFTRSGGGAPTISISRDATGSPVITYTGTLVSSPTVKGTYQPVQGATSPFKPIVQSGSTIFYQARN